MESYIGDGSNPGWAMVCVSADEDGAEMWLPVALVMGWEVPGGAGCGSTEHRDDSALTLLRSINSVCSARISTREGHIISCLTNMDRRNRR